MGRGSTKTSHEVTQSTLWYKEGVRNPRQIRLENTLRFFAADEHINPLMADGRRRHKKRYLYDAKPTLCPDRNHEMTVDQATDPSVSSG